MSLSADQLTDIQGDLAIGSDESVFTDDELNRLYARAEDDYNLAVYYGWRQIWADSAKWVDYQVAQTRVSRSQAFGQIEKMVSLWEREAKVGANQLRVVGMLGVPPKHKATPASDTRQGYFKRGRWYPYADD